MSYIDDLHTTVNRVAAMLREMREDDAERRPAPEKWSPKEIIGHLIDSACNNHARFVRAQLEEDMIFPSYAQDAWVECQDYQRESWENLVTLWHAYNLHIVHLMRSTPEEELFRARHRHNLDEIGWRAVPREEPATLDRFMHDYVEHLKHHLLAILPPASLEATRL
jgi:hypothetical protein